MLFQQWPLQAMQCKREAFPSDSISRRDCNCFHMGLVESECTSLWNDNVHAVSVYTCNVHCTLYWSRDF